MGAARDPPRRPAPQGSAHAHSARGRRPCPARSRTAPRERGGCMQWHGRLRGRVGQGGGPGRAGGGAIRAAAARPTRRAPVKGRPARPKATAWTTRRQAAGGAGRILERPASGSLGCPLRSPARKFSVHVVQARERLPGPRCGPLRAEPRDCAAPLPPLPAARAGHSTRFHAIMLPMRSSALPAVLVS